MKNLLANDDRSVAGAPDLESDRAFAQQNQSAATACLPPDISALEDGASQRIRALNASPHAKLRRLHAITDEVMAQFDAATPCKAGCGGCCHYEVKIYPIEASYIARNSGRPLRKEPAPNESFHGRPCVFLQEGRCSIYAVRPVVCRTHLAFTPTAYWCQPERSNDHEMPMLTLTGIRDALGQIVVQSGQTRQYDIRQLFDPGPSAARES